MNEVGVVLWIDILQTRDTAMKQIFLAFHYAFTKVA